MDVHVVGRDRVEELAIIEELSGPPRPVRAADRRWMLAIAAIAAVVCLGFAGDLVSPQPIDDAVAVPAPGTPAPSHQRADASAPAGVIEVELVGRDAVVIGGFVPLLVRTSPNHKVHLSVTIGTAVVGWRNLEVGASGSWRGDVRVFAPRVALPAVVHAATQNGQVAVEASDPFELGGGSPIVVWEASVVAGRDGGLTVAYRASAPLTFTRIDARVTDARGRQVGASRAASRVEDWRAGSAGARDLGIGSVVDVINIRGRGMGRLVLTMTWHDASTGATGTLDWVLEPAGSDQPD